MISYCNFILYLCVDNEILIFTARNHEFLGKCVPDDSGEEHG